MGCRRAAPPWTVPASSSLSLEYSAPPHASRATRSGRSPSRFKPRGGAQGGTSLQAGPRPGVSELSGGNGTAGPWGRGLGLGRRTDLPEAAKKTGPRLGGVVLARAVSHASRGGRRENPAGAEPDTASRSSAGAALRGCGRCAR